jgi:hypothetical protein
LATILEGKGNHSGAIHHLKQVLTVDPNFLDGGHVEKLLLAVSCHLKFSTSGYTVLQEDNGEVSAYDHT